MITITRRTYETRAHRVSPDGPSKAGSGHPLYLLRGCRRRLLPSLAEQPLVVGMVLYPPLAHGSCHDVEIVEVVARGRRDHVVTLRHEHYVTVVERKRLVERAVFGVDPLQSEAFVGSDLMVVSLFQVPLARGVIPVVFVRRVARPVAVWGQDLDHQEPLRFAILHQDRTYFPLHAARAAYLHIDVPGPDAHRVDPTLRRRGGDRNLQFRRGVYRVPGAGRQIERIRRPFEDALPATEILPLLVPHRYVARPGERDQTHLLILSTPAHAPACLEPEHLEPDELPTRRLRRNLYEGTVAVRLVVAGSEQVWHVLELLSRGIYVLSFCSPRTLCGRGPRTPSRRPRRPERPRRSRNRGRPRTGRLGCG